MQREALFSKAVMAFTQAIKKNESSCISLSVSLVAGSTALDCFRLEINNVAGYSNESTDSGFFLGIEND